MQGIRSHNDDNDNDLHARTVMFPRNDFSGGHVTFVGVVSQRQRTCQLFD